MKGDGWAVKRYVCPKCNKKGAYLSNRFESSRFHCMYCKDNIFSLEEMKEKNPILETEQPKFKP